MPTHPDDLLTASATSLAARIRDRELTSRQIVQAHIARAKHVNPILNAIVVERYQDALREAERADELTATSDPDALPPLHGVPCSIKESFSLKGMPHTGGLYARRDHIATEDAPSVARLRAAGAIPLGVTNVPELCMWYETSNRIYGRTNNAYNPAHIPGGSSGGEGAIVGAGAAPFGLGSDIGGSIRMPAFFNGIFGHKPSPDLVPNEGQFPNAYGPALRYLCAGPLCRRAEDLWPLLKILITDPSTGHSPLPAEHDPSRVAIDELDVLVVPTNHLIDPAPELQHALYRAADLFATRGARVRTIHLPQLKHSIGIWSSLMSRSGGPSFEKLLAGDQDTLKMRRELPLTLARRSPHTFPALALALIERLAPKLDKDLDRAVELGESLREDLKRLLTPKTILLFPSFPCVAPKHHAPMLMPAHPTYTAIFNVMQVPVTQTPMGLNERGLPLGVQIVAAELHDHLTIAAAQALEADAGGWTPPWTT